MPPVQNQRSKNRTLVECNCQLYCYRWNAEAQEYRGERVTLGTRKNHRKDEAEQRREQNRGQSYSSSEWLPTISDELQALASTPVVHPDTPLVFVTDPISVPFDSNIQDELLRPNHAPFSLATHPSNTHFLDVQTRLVNIYHLLQTSNQGASHVSLMEDIEGIMAKLVLEKHIQWNNQRYSGTQNHHVNTEIFFYRGHPRSKAYRCAVLVSLVLKHIYSTPLRAIRTQLAGLRSVLRLADFPSNEISQLPRDPRTITTYYRLQPITRQYICCPQCNRIYAWNGKSRGESGCIVPSQCTHQPATEDPVCGVDLWKVRRLPGNRTFYVPIKLYTHQPLKYWLGRLLSRPGIEDHIDNARTNTTGGDTNGPLNDIWGSPCLKSLKGHDEQPFLPGPGTEGRLIFGLAVDSFDPTLLKAASQSLSSTGIWLTLLNLPAHLRYLHENMYVAGVIPGPQKPSLDEINHYLDLVMDDLMEAFHPGIHLSRTYKYEFGRLYKAMLVPLICDMLAARQVIGQSSAPTAHSFCTVCDLDKDDIDILDTRQWPDKDIVHVRHYAGLWKSATTTVERKKLFDGSGIRWSSLLRLPYWNPAKFTVIDAMHTLDLGLFSNQCRSLFALDVEASSGDGTCAQPRAPISKRIYTKAHVAAYRKCIHIVVQNGPSLERELLELDRKVLYSFCVDNSITSDGHDLVVGTKWVLARSIIHWRDAETYSHPRLDIEEIREDQVARLSEEPEREATPEANTDLKNLLPTIKLLLLPTAENIEKLPSVATKKIYLQICDLLNVNYMHIDLRKRAAKRELQDYILEQLSNNDSYTTTLSQLLPKPNERVVLGKEVMAVVWSDMKKTQTPTWVATAPPNWGTTQRGKLSAAQWRVICTIHLPITLIRLWSGEEGRKRLLLDHFMDLVCAVRIANMKTSSAEQVAAYDKHIFRYVANICKIYPDQNLKPTHHCALHIGEFLESMGPTHSHNSPFFERYINFFHHQNTNSHPAEMDTTLLISSACSANLRGLLADDSEIRPLVCEMIDTMHTIDQEDIRGFRLASILDPNTPTATSRLKGKLILLTQTRQTLWRQCLETCGESLPDTTPTVISFPQIALQGVCYSTTDHIFRNSVIMFSEFVNQSSSSIDYQQLKAAFIDLIFQPHASRSTQIYYLLIRELIPVEEKDDLRDPYRRYGFASGFLCQQHHQTLRVIKLDQVVSHATLTPMQFDGFGDVYHILCVDRMMNIFSTFDYDTA